MEGRGQQIERERGRAKRGRDPDKRSDATRKQGDGDCGVAKLFDARLLCLIFVRVQRLASRQIAMRVSAVTQNGIRFV
jgi:hypothetical protein